MLSKMPWLSSRRRLLILSVFDYLIINIIFLNLQYNQIINTNLFAINIVSFCWIITSYTLDKYSIIEDEYNLNLIQKFFRNIKIMLITGIIFKAIIVIFSFFKSDVGDGRWIMLLNLIMFFSFLCEILHAFIVKKYFSKPINWISIYSDIEKGSAFLKLTNLDKYGYFSSVHISKINDLDKLNNSKYGFILEDINLLNNIQKSTLINLKNQGFKILSIMTWLERYLHRYPEEYISSTNILNEFLIYNQFNTSKRIKRFSEFLISLFLLIALSPIIFIFAIFIKIEDKGPILYSQNRKGFGGKIFTIYKLRSMKTNAEADGIKWSSKSDNRITKIGYWLRKTRIDELPQLFSVLNGDMSLIGPRPERPEIDKILEKEIPNYNLRYLVRPGLSGWAQVSYPYGASIEDTKMKFSYDIYYIKNLSTFFDLLIFLETIRLVFNFRGSQPIKRV